MTESQNPVVAGSLTMTARELQTALRTLGWPITVDGVIGPRTREATKDFQRGFAVERHSYSNLPETGVSSPRTILALKWALAHNNGASEHFAFHEFASHGNHWIRVSRALIRGLEAYRRLAGHPIQLASGYRDPAHNHAVGGATNSQHLYGNAADLKPELTVARVRALRCFSGIGYQAVTGLVRHVDVRHIGPNTTAGTISHPTIWAYA